MFLLEINLKPTKIAEEMRPKLSVTYFPGPICISAGRSCQLLKVRSAAGS